MGLRVDRGERVMILRDGTDNNVVTGLWSPELRVGVTPGRTPFRFPRFETLVQATVEPDQDGDGLGDDTQDPCPSTPNDPLLEVDLSQLGREEPLRLCL